MLGEELGDGARLRLAKGVRAGVGLRAGVPGGVLLAPVVVPVAVRVHAHAFPGAPVPRQPGANTSLRQEATNEEYMDYSQKNRLVKIS